jgi:hypothetical protein
MSNEARQTAGAIHIYLMEQDELLTAIESVERAMNTFRTLNTHTNVEANTYGDILDMLKAKKDLNEQRLVNLRQKLATEMKI